MSPNVHAFARMCEILCPRAREIQNAYIWSLLPPCRYWRYLQYRRKCHRRCFARSESTSWPS